MQKFFVTDCENNQKEIVITGDDARHISLSLRMRVGDGVTVCDGRGTDYLCEITAIDKVSVTLAVKECVKGNTEPPYRAVLYQALAKSDKMDTIIQKAVETGVTRIVPFESRFCIAKTGDNAENKLKRWRRIALEAAKQCGRCIIPEIAQPVSYREAVDECRGAKCAFICYEDERTLPLGAKAKRGEEEYRFFIGPEGGFSREEVAYARENGVDSVGLGHRILRCETASSFVLACLCMENELM